MTTVLGQQKALSYLAKLAATRKVAGAFLFFGPDGVGKKAAALEFAKALNCQEETARQAGVACGCCPSCISIDKGTHPDVTLVDFIYQARLELKKTVSPKDYDEELEKILAKQQHLSVSTIREVTAKSQQKSATDGWKVLIIDQAQTMQGAAANALLKFIEEPPAKTVWILITNKRFAMLRTILSRCQPLAFAPLSQDIVRQILTERELAVEDIEKAAKYSGGSVTGALAADKAISFLRESQFGTALGPMSVAGGLSHTAVVARQEAQAVLDVLIQALYQAWITKNSVGQTKLQPLLKRFETYKRSITRNVSPALVLETALMSLDGIDLSL